MVDEPPDTENTLLKSYGKGAPRELLLHHAREAPTTPGVYLMKDRSGTILYVGKAKSLKSRVCSYFQGERHEIPRIEILVSSVDHFDVILTGTEAEALILECTLIKKHKPRFNIRLKDDKHYPYIKLRQDQDFPRLEWTRRVQRDGARYFGPFPSAYGARQILRLLTETFKLRDCSDNTFSHRSRACILHQMGRCSGPCVGFISKDEYRATTGQAMAILEGKAEALLHELDLKMNELSEREEYEEAAQVRDQMLNLKVVTETQAVEESGVDRDREVFGFARKDQLGLGAVLVIRKGKLLSLKHFQFQNLDPSISDGALLRDFIAQFATSLTPDEDGPHAILPATEYLVPFAPEDSDTLQDVLKTVSGRLLVGESERDLQLLSVARANAQHSVEHALRQAKGEGIEALQEIQEKLQLEKLPHRIECYDISNFQGTDSVASRVVFMNGAADKNLYRRYLIREVQGQNDFAMMREVLGRRFKKTEEELPDLVVVDGGKGQLAQAVAILEELGVQGVDVVGLAKARTESDFESKEVKASMERVFIPGRKNPVSLLPHTASYRLLTQVRDEAHRFAVSYHRLRRAKRQGLPG